MSKKARLVKGSLAAKRHMAKLRKLAVQKRKSAKPKPIWATSPTGHGEMLTRAAQERLAQLPSPSMVEVKVWEERDRLHIELRHKFTGKTIAEWWDDDARQMFEDGFFKVTGPRMRGLDDSVIKYAQEMGLLAKGNPLTRDESNVILDKGREALDLAHRNLAAGFPVAGAMNAGMAFADAKTVETATPRTYASHRDQGAVLSREASSLIRTELDREARKSLGLKPNPLVMTVMGNPAKNGFARKFVQDLKPGDKQAIRNIVAGFHTETPEESLATFVAAKLRGKPTAAQRAAVMEYAIQCHRANQKLAGDVTRGMNPGPCQNPGHRHRNPTDYQDVYTAAQKVGYSVHDAARVASAFKRTGEMPRTVEAQLRYFKSNPEIKKVSTPPHFTVTCIGCGKKFNTLHEPAYADLQGEAFKAYYCRPCAVRACGREGLRSNPFEVRHYVKGKLDSVQADPYARGMKTSFKTRDEAERVFSDIGADRAQGYRIVETDSLGRARKPSKVKKAPLRADVVGVEVEPVKVWGGRASVVDDLKEANRFSVYFRTKKGPAEWVKDFSIHYPNAALRFANELALKYQVAVIAPRLPEGWGALVPNRNPVEGWVVTKDGETIKTFPGATDDFPAVQFLHSVQGQSVEYAVRYGGYDIVQVRGGQVVWSYKRDILKKKRNPSAGETWAIVPASSRASAGYTAAFKGTLQQAIKRAQASASIHKVNYEVWSTDDRNYRREGWLLKKHAITRPHGGYEIVRSNPSPKIRWEVHSSTEGVWVVGPLSKNEFPRLYGYRGPNFGSYANAMKYATARAKKYGLTVTDVTTAKSNPGVTPLDPKQYAGQDPELCASCGESLRHMGFREGRALFMCTSCGAKYSVKRGKAKRQSNPRLRIEYKRVDTTTLQGLRQAERLHQAGWKQGQVTPFSIQFYRKPSPDAVDRERVRRGMKPLQKPQANPRKGTRRKVTMTLEAFAKMVKAKNDPKLWSAFMKKVQDYKKWSHGTLPKKVTVEQIDVPGMSGMWMTYDAGKAPETAYVMPSGTKRKGAWVHQWDTMPDIKNDPDTGIVLTKLKGKSRITDFYHR